MNKLKKYIKENTTIFILMALFVITLTISANAKQWRDYKLNNQEREQQYKVLMDLVNKSDAKSKGLNEFLDIWEHEIQYLRDNFPASYDGDFYDYCNQETWNQSFNQLLEEIKADYVSDEDIYSRIKKIVPDELLQPVLKDYLKAIAILREDLIQ